MRIMKSMLAVCSLFGATVVAQEMRTMVVQSAPMVQFRPVDPREPTGGTIRGNLRPVDPREPTGGTIRGNLRPVDPREPTGGTIH